MSLLSVEKLRTCFHTRHGVVRAVEGVSFHVDPGETLGIVGESGCGKSVLNYSLLGLLPMPPGRIESGSARFEGTDLLHCSRRELRRVRGKRIAMVFQDPMTALNPYMRIGRQIMEPLWTHERRAFGEVGERENELKSRQGCRRSRGDADRERAVEALGAVGISDAAARMRMYPHELSGGMRQRVMIAMALINRPALLIADEPTTALDVTVQAQILELIKQRQQELGMALILVTHDLGVVAGVCDRVLVMYAGRIVETAETRRLFYHSQHPYTRALIAARPALGSAGEELYTIPGQPPDLVQPIPGCPFAPRCPEARPACFTTPCTLKEIASGHDTACLRVQNGDLALG
jgi:oligopeptide transport system ATP-binding protein